MRALSARRLADQDAEVVRREHADAIRELQATPASALRVLADIELPDATEVHVAHGLGRTPRWIAPSCVRGASTSGRIEEVRTASIDRARVLVIKASGYGATITVDLVVL